MTQVVVMSKDLDNTPGLCHTHACAISDARELSLLRGVHVRARERGREEKEQARE